MTEKVNGIRGDAERMKADLTLSDRFAILGILPAEGNFATLKIVRKLREQMSLTEAEIKKYGVAQIYEVHANPIRNAKTDAEAVTIATEIYGADNAQRISIGIRNGTIESNQITWEKGEEVMEMEFGEFAENMIKEQLIEMNEANKLEDRHFAIYEKFVEGAQ